MPRKKKEPIDLIEDTLESETLEETDDVEEIELSEEPQGEEEAAEQVSTEEEEKPKRKRRKATAKAEDSDEEATAEPEGVEAVEEKPAPARRKSARAAEPDPNDPILKQWELIRGISEAICVNLERVNSQLREMPAQYAAVFQDTFRPPIAKPAPITKVAVLVAGLALVLSVLSLSFSQSVRNTVLDREMVVAKHSRHATVPAEEIPKESEPAIAETARARTAPELARKDSPRQRVEPKSEAPAKRTKKTARNRRHSLPHQFE